MTRARFLALPAAVKVLISSVCASNGFGKEQPGDMERRVASDGPLLDDIALIIDGAQDCGDEAALRRAIQRCDEVEPDLLAESVPVLLYFRANAYAALLMISGGNKKWGWRKLELEAQILNLRRAIAHEAFGTLAEFRRLQILTNLANGFNQLGRSVEALEVYDNALAINPNLGWP
jgi:tetratricopeptide (TPR) repeat protein